MQSARPGPPEPAGTTRLTLPGPAITLAATTAIQVMSALAALSVPPIPRAVPPPAGRPASMVGTYISLVYLGSAAAALISGSLVSSIGALRVSQLSLVLSALGMVLGLEGTALALAASAVLLGL